MRRSSGVGAYRLAVCALLGLWCVAEVVGCGVVNNEACASGASGALALGPLPTPSADDPSSLPPSAYTTLKSGVTICRVENGMWQVSGAHGYQPDQSAAIEDMYALVQAGFTTFDLADIYGPAEDFVGAFLDRYRTALPPGVTFHTKFVPRGGPMPRAHVLRGLDRSRARMHVDTLDLVAFHWWDYGHPAYMEMVRHARDLVPEGVLKGVSLTNFDTKHVREMTEAGVDVVSIQSSCSVLDTRAWDGPLSAYSLKHDIKILCYGTLLGGFLSDKWLDRPQPDKSELETVSLQKYFQWIDLWGGWALFQELLGTLRDIGEKHSVGISSVAVRWVIQQDAVGAAILGMRLGKTAASHIEENRAIFTFELGEADLAAVGAVQAKARSLYKIIGDCGDEYHR